MQYQPNELRRDLLSSLGLQPWIGTVSSPRAQMFASHLGQKLVVAGATERFCQTGMEIEFGKYTFKVEMPEDGVIVKVIDKYIQTVDKDSIKVNPYTTVIYEDERTKQIGMFNLNSYCSLHQYFGFKYNVKSSVNSLIRGNRIAKGTIFLDSPAITDSGNYKYGVELNMAFMSHPAVSEDGILISRDVLPLFNFMTYESRPIEFGSKKFPLNLYGDAENFKAFPDIGEYVRDDGLLMVLRNYDELLAPVDQSIYDVMEVDHIFDKATYVSGPRGKVVDIKVYTADNSEPESYSDMDAQIQKYVKATKDYHLKIVKEWRRLKHERGDSLTVTPEFHRQVVESLAIIGEDTESPKISKIYRKNPIDDYRIEFTIEFENTPREGFKFTDTFGG